MDNPFEFKYPDEINPKDVMDLFVPVFGEYYNVPKSGHTFINGARGSGKSMMFRYMKPDCQILINSEGKTLKRKRNIKSLDYFGIYIPIKKGQLNKTDIKLNDKHGEALLNEHYMVLHFSIVIFKELLNTNFQETIKNQNAFLDFYNDSFCKLLKYAGYISQTEFTKEVTVRNILVHTIDLLKSLSSDFQHNYIHKLIGRSDPLPYNGPIFLYSEFLYEVLKKIQRLPFMPDKPIYLLIDDADELSVVQRMILNSWVAMRTTTEVSLKISTQLKYRVFRTINESRIDTPHDYSEVNINDIYTTQKDVYYKRIDEIVVKRLKKYKCEITDPTEYFPEDIQQANNIEKKRIQYIDDKKSEGFTEAQAYDYAYRYTIPDFIKELQGNRYTYSYAGFRQLVNISSGNIREFIDFASEMYVNQQSTNNNNPVKCISHSIQDKEIKKVSDKKMESEFDKFREEAQNKRDMDKLRNLLLGMGGLFRVILNSDTSERRVFSIALNDEPDEELRNILSLGIQHGYLQKSMIGNKYGTGKARLYILNRILAPHFGLDPTSFAGYKFMNARILKKSLTNPAGFIDIFKSKIKGAEKYNQPSLFENI
ncbi:MAG: hypothetical protein ISS18_02990 [Bacteroidales bacterium]|nr:hypothetical protein [Bacteroidales bacterium]